MYIRFQAVSSLVACCMTNSRIDSSGVDVTLLDQVDGPIQGLERLHLHRHGRSIPGRDALLVVGVEFQAALGGTPESDVGRKGGHDDDQD